MVILAKILYGSQNYALDTEQSDKDYKLIALPDFEDLYYNRKLELPEEYDENHYSVMDIRQWLQLLKKGSFNAVEYLFSTELLYNGFTSTDKFIKFIETLRKVFTQEQYIAEVWPLFYNACVGLCSQTTKRCGFTAKTVSRMYWITQFLRSVVVNNFNIPENIFGYPISSSRDLRKGEYINDEEAFYKHLADLLFKDMESIDKMAREFLADIKQKDWKPTFFTLDYQIQQMIKERI